MSFLLHSLKAGQLKFFSDSPFKLYISNSLFKLYISDSPFKLYMFRTWTWTLSLRALRWGRRRRLPSVKRTRSSSTHSSVQPCSSRRQRRIMRWKVGYRKTINLNIRFIQIKTTWTHFRFIVDWKKYEKNILERFV